MGECRWRGGRRGSAGALTPHARLAPLPSLRSPLREALPLPQGSRLHSWMPVSPHPRALLKGRVLCSAGQAPSLGLHPFLHPGIPSFLEKSKRNFPVESHLPGERGSLWMVTAKSTAPSRQASAPRVLQGCQATTSSWYFESGSSHARPSKGWLCAVAPGLGEWGGVKPKGPGGRCQGLGQPAERTGLASCGSSTSQHPGAWWGPLLAWGDLGGSGSRESVLLSANLAESPAVASGSSAHLPALKACSRALPGQVTHLLRHRQWLPGAYRTRPHLLGPRSRSSPVLSHSRYISLARAGASARTAFPPGDRSAHMPAPAPYTHTHAHPAKPLCLSR